MSERDLLPFFVRLWMAFVCFFQILLKPRFAAKVFPAYQTLRGLPDRPERSDLAPAPRATAPAPVATPAPRPAADQGHAPALFVLGALQREGRLIDFLQEDVGGFTDDQVGAAARVVHEGCRKVLTQYLALEPVLKEAEGARVTVPLGFDAERIRLTGNVTGTGPFAGSLKHHGWVTRQVRFPTLSDSLDPRVLAPAEVELT